MLDIEPDGKLTAEQLDRVNSFSEEDVEVIDSAILSCCSTEYMKIARICAAVISNNGFQVPDVYVANRVREFVTNGVLEYQGYLGNMRYCEVKLKFGATIS